MRYALISAVAAMLIAAPAAAEDWDFILVNNAGKEIKKIELSPTGAGDWQTNRLEEDQKEKVVKVGGRTTVHFDKKDNACRYDVRATFSDSTNAIWSGINVCDNSFVTISYKNGAPAYTAN
ncbi:hypothetical protein ACFQ1E_04380 [Sphingomonas canadensis]|uniref:Argininosuccinate lyase n=1 Tax=Sphingomonas canadensis TaxID=1219257 RepID=A0ABW3H266_9SPHN|nr:hypothetical protein [Sphingomonas canadensis]MCW3834519.1 hypothetical protein [Sphingomonas canadensis]